MAHMEEELGGVLPYLIIKSPMKPPLTSECVISVSHLLKEVIDVDKLKGWVNDAFDPDIKEFVRLTEQMGEPHSNMHFSSECEMAKPDKAGCDPIFFLHHTFLDYLWAYWQELQEHRGIKKQ